MDLDKAVLGHTVRLTNSYFLNRPKELFINLNLFKLLSPLQ